MAWAKDALERNDRIEVVASDPQAKTFTVRVKESGQLVVLPIDQVTAGPGAALAAPGQQTAMTPTSNPSEAPSPPPPAPETSVPEAAPPPVAPAHSEAPSPGPSQQTSNPVVASEAATPGEPAQAPESVKGRSEERRVGKECRAGWSAER